MRGGLPPEVCPVLLPTPSIPNRNARRLATCARLLTVSLFAAGLAPVAAIAAPVVLEDGVGFVTVDPESQDGIGAWTVNGVQHVRQQWFWVQPVSPAHANPESSLDVIHSVTTASDATGDGLDDTLDVDFDGLANLVYRPRLHLELTSTPLGGANELVSQLVTEITFQATQVGLHLRVFQYTDVDLFGSYPDDDAVFTGGTAFVTDASGLGVYESSWDVLPDAVEAANYDTTLASLNDALPTVLSGSTSASGDVTLATMWEIDVPVGTSLTLRQTQTIRVVPEPGVATLVALGLAALAARRKENSR